MAKPKTQGCADASVHEGHEWFAVVRNKRHNAESRWCPGRVICDACGKHVFRSTVKTVPGVGYICARKCR